MFVRFNSIEVLHEDGRIIFKENEYGTGQLDYIELLIGGYMDYIYYHYGDDPMTCITIDESDYADWLQDAIKNGTEI